MKVRKRLEKIIDGYLDFNMKIIDESNDEGESHSKILLIIFMKSVLEMEDSMDSDYKTKRKRKV